MPTIFKAPNKKTPAAPTKAKMMAPMSAFALKPGGVRFETQESEETVELFVRQHPIVNIPWITIAAILLFVPSFIPILIHSLQLPFTLPANYLILIMAFWYVATFGFILTNLMHWFFNIYIVTNERIVDIDFYFLLYKHFAEAELNKVQDISFTSSGLLATVFNYGNVVVQTAGEIPNIEFEMVPQPEKVVETIRSLIEQTEGIKHG